MCENKNHHIILNNQSLIINKFVLIFQIKYILYLKYSMHNT